LPDKKGDFMSIIVRLKINRTITAEHWKSKAIGTIDEYGNPFRIITLRWNTNPMHKMAEYVKTRGFEDAVIQQDRATGDIAIRYRDSGCIMWMRPMGGVGAFEGEVAYTPKNMEKLAAMHGDKLWTIKDHDIAAIVEQMYKKRVSMMSADVLKFNQDRIRGMHQMSFERDAKAPEVALDIDKTIVKEEARLNEIKKIELDKREAKLRAEEKEVLGEVAGLAGEGVNPAGYSKEYLEKQTFYNLRKISKQLGIKYNIEAKKPDLIQGIIEKQDTGTVEVVDTLDG
jgi:hypothetical protein